MASLTIMTWNIHGGVGADGRCDLDRVVKIIRRQSPDIVALQEVDGRAHLGRRELAFEYLAERLGPHAVEARTVRRTNRDYGHLLWSRWPLLSAAVHTLPGVGMEERAAIEVEAETPQGRLRVMATHLGLSPLARRAQAAFLSRMVARGSGPLVVMGDFNDWRLAGSVHRLLGGALPAQVLPKTWPARRPFLRMDRIYASADLTVTPRPHDARARAASDHLPVVAELGLG